MSRQNRRKHIYIENIEIIDTANKGKSVAKHDGRIIFVQGGVPGDICNITVFKRRKKRPSSRSFSKSDSLFSQRELGQNIS